jgi:hypothetical protein
VNDIHSVSRKPPLGTPPASVKTASDTTTGYSPAATAIARIFGEQSERGLFADPQFMVSTLARDSRLSTEDVEAALHELSAFVNVSHQSRAAQGQSVCRV